MRWPSLAGVGAAAAGVAVGLVFTFLPLALPPREPEPRPTGARGGSPPACPPASRGYGERRERRALGNGVAVVRGGRRVPARLAHVSLPLISRRCQKPATGVSC